MGRRPFKPFSGDCCSLPRLGALCSLTGAWKIVGTLPSMRLLLLPFKQLDRARTKLDDLSSLPLQLAKRREGVTEPMSPRGQQEKKTGAIFPPPPRRPPPPPRPFVLPYPRSQPPWKRWLCRLCFQNFKLPTQMTFRTGLASFLATVSS